MHVCAVRSRPSMEAAEAAFSPEGLLSRARLAYTAGISAGPQTRAMICASPVHLTISAAFEWRKERACAVAWSMHAGSKRGLAEHRSEGSPPSALLSLFFDAFSPSLMISLAGFPLRVFLCATETPASGRVGGIIWDGPVLPFFRDGLRARLHSYSSFSLFLPAGCQHELASPVMCCMYRVAEW